MFFYTCLPRLLNMSLTASVVIVFVLLLRLLLKKAPKVISYALWGIVLFRLLCPISIESGLSLFGLLDTPVVTNGSLTSRIAYIPSDIVHMEYPSVVLPAPGIGEAISETLPQGEEQLVADPLEAPVAIATYVWMAGVVAMGMYGVVSCLRLGRRLVTASRLRENIYLADAISSPFVLGVFRPRIYLPSSLGERERPYIVMHEQHHIKRCDHVVKLLAFIALSIHWFNPLVWLAFLLSAQDMEMSCDEAVIRKMGNGVLADYTASLLSLATGTPIVAGTPLAFGEGDPKGRIRNLAHWKKPSFGGVLVGVAVCILMAGFLLTNPKYTPTVEEALLQLEHSLRYEGDAISFRIPPYDKGVWNIHIAGRAVYDDGFSQSLHYLEGEAWTPGTSYTFQPDSAAVELMLDVSFTSPSEGEWERTIDLLSKRVGDTTQTKPSEAP